LTREGAGLYFDIETFDGDQMPTHQRGKNDEVQALNAFIRLARSMNALQARLLPPLQKEFGLTESQLGVLEALFRLGPLPQGELCRKILRSGSNLTTVVDNLERGELVRRERDEHDRRVQVVHLTDRGRAVVSEASPAQAARIMDVMRVLSTEEQRELGRLCRKLGTAAAS
jgi:MarR family 2-MHQ and catechol resistance regulon transcriptional repressor